MNNRKHSENKNLFDNILYYSTKFTDSFPAIKEPKDYTELRVLTEKLRTIFMKKMNGYEDLEKYSKDTKSIFRHIEEDYEVEFDGTQFRAFVTLTSSLERIK